MLSDVVYFTYRHIRNAQNLDKGWIIMKRKVSILAMLVLTAFTVSMLTACSFGKSAKLEMSESTLDLTVGSSANLTVTDSPGSLTWTSSDDKIASVENGTVTAKSVGSAVIKAEDEKGNSCSCNVSVNNKEITSMALDRQTASVDAGKSVQLTATYSPSDASDTNLTWTSSDESVAVVNSSGNVTGVKAGVANITCRTKNNVEASCTVTVKGSTASSQSSNNNASNDRPPVNDDHYGHFNPNYTYRSSDFVFPESSTRKLTRSEINSVLGSMSGSSVSGSFAQDAVNEIYARNGYCFRDAHIRNYYEAQPWYYADESFTTSDFNSIENYNINLLLEYT